MRDQQSSDRARPDRSRSRLLGRLLRAETAAEGHRVTTLELFFDLVYVFAFTQVTYVMSHGEGAIAVVQGVITLALLWWSWTSFAWLANQAHADRGIVHAAVIVAMASMFLVSLTIPEAYHDLEGGLHAPLVFAVCYTVVRLVHLTVYSVAAGSDAGLRRQIFVSLFTAALPSSALLVVGALLPENVQVWIWGAAIAFDLVVIYVTSIGGGGWRVYSAAHFSERHALVVILALGESIVAIGVGVSLEPISVPILVGSVLAVAVAVAMWWVYFHHTASAGERRLEALEGQERARLASDAYTYLHFAIVAGVILTALGVEQVMAHLTDDHLGPVGAWALAGGPALYLAATGFFLARVSGRWAVVRFAAALASLLFAPAALILAPLAALSVSAALVALPAALEHFPHAILSRPRSGADRSRDDVSRAAGV